MNDGSICQGSGDILTLGADTLLLLNGLESRPQLAANVDFFWEGYVLGRWDLAIGAFDSTATRSRGIGHGRPSQVLLQLDRMLENPEGRNWFSGEVHKYFLENSAKIIRSTVDR
jgi:hypothetical protein